MVVSKDPKRKRKESPPVQPTAVAVESSPEMPKRTKVQAQRKFAQGQSAPTSAYSSIIAASSSSNTGPSTSSESREPPTEILPNKRPKTEDFLTFLCFRGTSALPPHLDFLNQGKSKEPEKIVNKNVSKPAKANKKGKKGRPKGSVGKAAGAKSSASTATLVKATEDLNSTEKLVEKNDSENCKTQPEGAVIPPFAVRKRAEVVTEGNRRGRQLRNANDAEKCNKLPESKRRSNRSNAKDTKSAKGNNSDDDEDDEYFSANDDADKAQESDKEATCASKSESKKAKTPTLLERKSETPSKESETGKSRRGRPASTTKKGKEAIAENAIETGKSKESPKSAEKQITETATVATKEKAPVKRQRQKESPIFIPSPEPSGRMTRQRAFFEPVKVVHREEEEEAKAIEQSKNERVTDDNKKVIENSTSESKEHTNTKLGIVRNTADESPENDKEKPNLNVFDFSSDDEQPLSKSMKLKKGKASPKKSNSRAAKAGRKTSPKKSMENKEEIKNKTIIEETKEPCKVEEVVKEENKLIEDEKEIKDDANKNKNKRGKGSNAKKKVEDALEEDKELSPPSPKKSAVGRQARKKGKPDNKAINGEDEKEKEKETKDSAVPVRNQRPTRKTKEAAAIYMGIIGHKLQLPDDEDDDLSLSSFPDLPNVKEMEKMENELKKNAAQTAATASAKISNAPPMGSSLTAANKSLPKQTTVESPVTVEKTTSGRRGRPPKPKQPPIKREIEGMLVKKGALAKIAASVESSVNYLNTADKDKTDHGKVESDDEDFLLNEEVNETKRKLEKSFSDSDDEPLAIKVNVKPNEKDEDVADTTKPETLIYNSIVPIAANSVSATASLGVLPISTKPTLTSPLSTPQATNASPSAAAQQTASQAPSIFKTIEKKSPVPTSKILNVPATYAMPGVNSSSAAVNVAMSTNFSKASYLPPASPHYHTSHVRAATHQFPSAKSPTAPLTTTQTISTTHLATPLPPQSPIKYQAAPTTYPPPIEAYPSPKINPNFLTPKFDRTSLPRSNNFPSPSPVKFDVASAAAKAGLTMNTTLTSKTTIISAPTPVGATTTTAAPSSVTGTAAVAIAAGAVSAAAAAAAAAATAATTAVTATASSSTQNVDPLKDEIGSILAANLMPSKEESGKIFGIASVSLAQSSGPDNTKCTLGKCGSIHKPVLGPVVPTEGYIGDQLSSKERRKAKVNMTHEQIQKWLIECSSNPDEIQDDLDDDFFDNLRPNLFAATPPPTRDDKESTSFSSSSKATRDLGKSESAWSAKGPSLKATPVVASANRKDDSKQLDSSNQIDIASENEKTSGQAINLSHKAGAQNSNANEAKLSKAEKSERKADKKLKEDKSMGKEYTNRDNKQSKIDKEKEKEKEKESTSASTKATVAGSSKQSNTVLAQSHTSAEPPTTPKQNKRKNATTTADEAKNPLGAGSGSGLGTGTATGTAGKGAPERSGSSTKTPKRTPVYNQKAQQKQIVEPKETPEVIQKKPAPFSYGAFSADNEKSIYSFDKDDEVEAGESKTATKPAFRRQSRRDSHQEETVHTTTSNRTSSSKKRTSTAAATGPATTTAATATEKGNKDNQNSISLTLSPSENCKLVKVSLDAEKTAAGNKAGGAGGKASTTKASKKNEITSSAASAAAAALAAATATAASNNNDGDSDSDGHTFYIPLHGSGAGKDGEGDIQGVAVKLGREGPEGPNQKVIMHATLVTKAQMGSNSKPLPESVNAADIVKTLMMSAQGTTTTQSTKLTTTGKEPATSKKTGSVSNAAASTSAAAAVAAAAAAANSASGSLKNVPIGTVQPRFKGTDLVNASTAVSTANAITTTTTAAAAANISSTTPTIVQPTSATAGSGLMRANSNSSLLSSSAKSRIAVGASGGVGAAGIGTMGTATATSAAHGTSKKFKDVTPIKMANNTAFPRHDDPTQMVEAPIFRPTEKEFADPIDFIERITPIAARFGICKIIPPSTFKPECRISDEMRFTAYNQYVHKMLHRWGPSAKELSAIKKYLATQNIVMNHQPWIGGMEVDLPRLYHTVQELGGLKEVIEKKKWARVAEEMCIPKLAQDRVTKLDDIYCKYLLPYDTLSPAERQKLFDEVEADWAKREARARRNADRFVNTESVSNEEDDATSEDDEESEEEVDGVSMECIVKGRSMPLSQFYRIARNTMALWFKNTEPTVNEVEAEFWRHVAVRDSHVCVHSGSIDSSGWGYGFPSPGPKGKGSNYARHPWNLKVLTNNPGSVLRSLGPVMGVTVPTLHVGMLFSACCWYRDPHGLSWIEYLHTGASKLWYGIPDDQSANFRAALTSLIPTHCQNKTIWLPCDTVMVPPHMLTDRGVSLCRIEQKPGEFIVVFPRAYTSSLATGYVVSESVYFATSSWLDLAKDDFRDIHDSCEPAMFSLEQLLFALGYDQRVTPDILQQMLPMLHDVCEKESAAREQLKAAGVTSAEKVQNEKGSKSKKQQHPPFKSIESECDLCRANLYISMIRTEEGNVYCLQHALKNLNNGNIQAKQCKLIYAYNVEDIENLIKNLKEKIQQKRNVGTSKKVK